ncbi:hypothetical protein FISHEDRAFT_62769 [Fistulina hepatica ATCC 64428]|nr:hypothetical protein FISHEDRAFT_62769 [Fistulina hepatica ATCC 64428]
MPHAGTSRELDQDEEVALGVASDEEDEEIYGRVEETNWLYDNYERGLVDDVMMMSNPAEPSLSRRISYVAFPSPQQHLFSPLPDISNATDDNDVGNASDSDDNIDVVSIHIDNVKVVYQYILFLHNAILKNGGFLDANDIFSLENPPQSLPNDLHDPNFHLSLDNFFACANASDDVYSSIQLNTLYHYPDSKILSLDQIKCRVQNHSGIFSIKHDMCINSCLAFMGPFTDATECPCCSESRYTLLFLLVLVGRNIVHIRRPQLQVLYCHPETAQDLAYQNLVAGTLWDFDPENWVYEDIIDGKEH